ncbi:MAG: hypothetical protein U9N52_10850 [Campylobacterota bacterium]|nr:hypothetical protein [Campylobacterota bacterium]
MTNNIDIKPILNWAVAHGEARIIDRILMKLLPQFIKNGHKITESDIQNRDTFLVSQDLYDLVKKQAEELIGSSYTK